MKRVILKQKVYHDGTSMIVLAVGDEHQVPARWLQDWIDEGIVAGKTRKQIAREAADAGDDDAGEGSGADPLFTIAHVGGGYYAVSGPGMGEPERVKGKVEAEVRAAELESAHAAALAEGNDGEGGGAPTE